MNDPETFVTLTGDLIVRSSPTEWISTDKPAEVRE